MKKRYLALGKSLLYFLGPYVVLLLMYLLHQANIEASMSYTNTSVSFYRYLLAICFGLIVYYLITVRINGMQRKALSTLNAVVFAALLIYARFSGADNEVVSTIMVNELTTISLIVILILNAIRAWISNNRTYTFLDEA